MKSSAKAIKSLHRRSTGLKHRSEHILYKVLKYFHHDILLIILYTSEKNMKKKLMKEDQ